MNPTDEAIYYIINYCPTIGSYSALSLKEGLCGPPVFLQTTAIAMKEAKPSVAFPDRHKEHIAYALQMVASSNFLEPPAAVASVYLATRFEFYFRVLSGRLKADGTWKTPEDKQEVRNLLTDDRLKKKLKKDRENDRKNDRINSVADAYKIMKTNTGIPLAQVCNGLDTSLYPEPRKMPDKKTVSDIGGRIQYLRHRVAHGHWGDISSESMFYALLTAIVFYNQL